MRLPLIALFLAVIATPLAVNLAGKDGGDAGAENRELASFPRYAGSVRSLPDYGDRFGEWFDDHFGLRADLVRWYGQTRLFGLGVSPTTAVHKGRDGWFFYADDKATEDYASDDLMTDEEIANWRATVVKIQRWLDARHIGWLFVIAPDKHFIYPEAMPGSIVRANAMSRTDQIYGSLADTRALVDIRPALEAAKARERIYFKTDTHWNDRGAQVAYQSIIEAARLRVPAIPPAWTRDDFEPVERMTEAGDLAGMMGLRRVMTEEDLTLQPKRPRLARVIEPAGATELAEVGRLVTEIPGSSLPRAVIFRDSFTSRLVPFLSEHFSRAVYLWQNDFESEAIDRERPDIVIQELVGRHLYTFVPTPALIPDR